MDEEERRRIEILVNTPSLPPLPVAPVNGRAAKNVHKRPKTTPPSGYLCRRCNVAGHFIQHCPTNGDPNYDVRVVRAPKGIPKSMLMANPDGCYVLPGGETAVLKPNEAVFAKEVEAMPSTTSSDSSLHDFPPELLCPLCKKIMKDAVFTSRCCFSSFCDGCIRDYLINSKFKCECGATDMLADYLIPNITVRATIRRFLESGPTITSSRSSGNSKTAQTTTTSQLQDKGSVAHCSSQPNIPSSSKLSAAEAEQKPSSPVNVEGQMGKKARTAKSVDVSEATSGFMSTVKETTSKRNVGLLADDGVQQKLVSGELEKKKRKRKSTSQDMVETEGYMMPTGSCAYNPYWPGMWTEMEGYVSPYYPGAMSYGFDQFGMPYGGLMPQDSFSSY